MQAESIGMGFRTNSAWRMLAILLALLTVGCAHREKAAPPAAPPAAETPKAPEAAANAPRPVMQQQALDLLKRMSETLAGAKAFTYRSHSMAEEPAVTGQFLTFFGHADVALERPNKLHANVGGDIPNFHFYYDGSNVTAFDPEKNLYAISSGAPGTIDEMLPFVMEKAGIQFPAADFLYSDPYGMMTKDVISAMDVGPSKVDGFPCEHLAFMGPGVNWEVWIDSGKQALPRRMAVTYKEATNFPRFLVEFSDWNLKPKLAASTFAFKKPANAKQIEFAPLAGGEFKKQ